VPKKTFFDLARENMWATKAKQGEQEHGKRKFAESQAELEKKRLLVEQKQRRAEREQLEQAYLLKWEQARRQKKMDAMDRLFERSILPKIKPLGNVDPESKTHNLHILTFQDVKPRAIQTLLTYAQIPNSTATLFISDVAALIIDFLRNDGHSFPDVMERQGVRKELNLSQVYINSILGHAYGVGIIYKRCMSFDISETCGCPNTLEDDCLRIDRYILCLSHPPRLDLIKKAHKNGQRSNIPLVLTLRIICFQDPHTVRKEHMYKALVGLEDIPTKTDFETGDYHPGKFITTSLFDFEIRKSKYMSEWILFKLNHERTLQKFERFDNVVLAHEREREFTSYHFGRM
jgi:hypothetical protein